MKYWPPSMAHIPRLARRMVARALRASWNAIVLAFLFAACRAADSITFDPSPTPNVSYRLRWTGQTNGSVDVGTNRLLALGPRTAVPSSFTVTALANGLESDPSNALALSNQPPTSLMATSRAPISPPQLRTVANRYVIQIDVDFGSGFAPLAFVTNDPARLTVMANRAVFRARALTNLPPIPVP